MLRLTLLQSTNHAIGRKRKGFHGINGSREKGGHAEVHECCRTCNIPEGKIELIISSIEMLYVLHHYETFSATNRNNLESIPIEIVTLRLRLEVVALDFTPQGRAVYLKLMGRFAAVPAVFLEGRKDALSFREELLGGQDLLA